MKPKPKICQACGAEYMPFNSLQRACSVPCALKIGKESARKAAINPIRAEARKAKARMKGRSEWLKDVQAACNRYIRLRDAGKPCVSCGHPDDGSRQRHASHYRPQGNCSPLRFHHMNLHASCSICNNHYSGNLVEYKKKLIELYGERTVNWMESINHTYSWEIEDLKQIKKFYQEQIKLIENN